VNPVDRVKVGLPRSIHSFSSAPQQNRIRAKEEKMRALMEQRAQIRDKNKALIQLAEQQQVDETTKKRGSAKVRSTSPNCRAAFRTVSWVWSCI